MCNFQQVVRATAELSLRDTTLFTTSGVVLVEGISARLLDAISADDQTALLLTGDNWDLDGRGPGDVLGAGPQVGERVEPTCAGFVIADGTEVVVHQYGSTVSGSVEWFVWYRPLSEGAKIEVSV